jgi:hypothetical protein
MKDKLTINNLLLDDVRSKSDLANVKILSETPIGNETILLLRFRSPSALFTLAKYVFQKPVEKTKTKQHEKVTKKVS